MSIYSTTVAVVFIDGIFFFTEERPSQTQEGEEGNGVNEWTGFVLFSG